MIIGQGLLPVRFFPSQWNLSMSLADNFSFISFTKKSITTSSETSFSFSFLRWIKRQFLLEYYSWRSTLLSIVSIFSFKDFASFLSSKICHSFSFLSASTSSNFLLMDFMDLLTFSMCLVPLISASFVEKKAQKSPLPFIRNFASSCIKCKHTLGILFLFQKYMCHLY